MSISKCKLSSTDTFQQMSPFPFIRSEHGIPASPIREYSENKILIFNSENAANKVTNTHIKSGDLRAIFKVIR